MVTLEMQIVKELANQIEVVNIILLMTVIFVSNLDM